RTARSFSSVRPPSFSSALPSNLHRMFFSPLRHPCHHCPALPSSPYCVFFSLPFVFLSSLPFHLPLSSWVARSLSLPIYHPPPVRTIRIAPLRPSLARRLSSTLASSPSSSGAISSNGSLESSPKQRRKAGIFTLVCILILLTSPSYLSLFLTPSFS